MKTPISTRTSRFWRVLGVALADAFIGCWDAKYKYDLVRPITYIRRLIDKKWEALLITPPFPEYPSRPQHRVRRRGRGADAAVRREFRLRGSHRMRRTVCIPRKFASFWAAAEDAGISRLYGGIHYPRGDRTKASNRGGASAPMPTR